MHIDPYIVLGSAIVGLLVGMTGAGGGALMTPMLILLFGVSPSSVSRWRTRERVQGDARPKALGGDRKSHRIDAHKATILSRLDETPDIAIEELRCSLSEKGLIFGFGTIRRFFARHKITRKKRPPMLQNRIVPTS